MKEFKTFEEFGNHIKKVIASEAIYKKATLTILGKFIQDASKRKFGHYQPDHGLFEEWAELKDATQEQRQREGYSPNDPLYRSGELMESIEFSVVTNSVFVGSKNPIMAYQELGTNHIPPRPVLGAAMFENRDKIKKIVAQSVRLWLKSESLKQLEHGYGTF